MLLIGIIGGKEVYKMAEMLYNLYLNNARVLWPASDQTPATTFDNKPQPLAAIYPTDLSSEIEAYNMPSDIDILIINSDDHIENFLRQGIRFKMAVINSDIKDIYRYLGNFGGRVITYGFNGKACVTASSVMEGDAFLCVQRAIETVSGDIVMQQDFPVSLSFSQDEVSSLLGAVTAAIAQGIKIEDLGRV